MERVQDKREKQVQQGAEVWADKEEAVEQRKRQAVEMEQRVAIFSSIAPYASVLEQQQKPLQMGNGHSGLLPGRSLLFAQRQVKFLVSSHAVEAARQAYVELRPL